MKLPLHETRPIFYEGGTQPRLSQCHSELEAVLRGLEKRPVSVLMMHPGRCCEVARAWFRTLARSVVAVHPGPPMWIRERWEWGPTSWPVYWCDLAKRDKLDCGALAALAREACLAVGNEVRAVQLLERFDTTTIENWRTLWGAEAEQWTFGDLVYHEAVALLAVPQAARPEEEARAPLVKVRIWDPTDLHWVEGNSTTGLGSLVALRVCAGQGLAKKHSDIGGFRWDGVCLRPCTWEVFSAAFQREGQAHECGQRAT